MKNIKKILNCLNLPQVVELVPKICGLELLDYRAVFAWEPEVGRWVKLKLAPKIAKLGFFNFGPILSL